MDIKPDDIVISVIIPMYNASSTIKESLESIIAQTHKTIYQIIIVNDGSTDNSLNIVKAYIKQNITNENICFKLIDKTNGGAAAARNDGLLAATGDYIAFLDSDDRWMPNKIERQINYLTKNPSVDMVGGIFGNDKINILKKMGYENRICINDQIMKNYFSPPTVLFRRSILEKTGLFNQNMRFSEEGFFFNKMVYHGTCILLNEKVAESITNKKRWGESGLSGNLLAMEKGELFNIRQAYKDGYIGLGLYLIGSLFSLIKFFRRVIIKLFRL